MLDTVHQPEKAAELEPDLYPVFLKLVGRKVLLVGGGQVASKKLAALVAAKAAITVVAPRILPAIINQGVRCLRRPFRARDLDGAWYVVSAAPDHVNRHVERIARERRVFVNAVDDAKQASSYLGGVVRKGGVTLAVSTQGKLPALAGMLREALVALIPDDIEQWIMAGQSTRREWNANCVPHDERRPLLLRVLNDIYAASVASPQVGEPREHSHAT